MVLVEEHMIIGRFPWRNGFGLRLNHRPRRSYRTFDGLVTKTKPIRAIPRIPAIFATFDASTVECQSKIAGIGSGSTLGGHEGS